MSVLARQVFCVCFSVFQMHVLFYLFVFVVSTGAINCLEKLVSKMTCYVWSDM